MEAVGVSLSEMRPGDGNALEVMIAEVISSATELGSLTGRGSRGNADGTRITRNSTNGTRITRI